MSGAVTIAERTARASGRLLLSLGAGVVSGLSVATFGAASLAVIPAIVGFVLMMAIPYSGLYAVVASLPANIEIVGPLSLSRLAILLGLTATFIQTFRRQVPSPSLMAWPEGAVAMVFFAWVALATVAIGKGAELARFGPFIIYAATFFMVMIYTDTKARLHMVLVVLVAVGVLEAFLALGEAFLGFKPFSGVAHTELALHLSEGETRVTGTTSHPITFAGYFQLVIAAAGTLALTARARSAKLLYLAIMALLLVAWSLTFVRSSWIGMAVMVLTGMMLASNFTRVVALIGVFTGSLLLVTHDFSLVAVVDTIEGLGSVEKVKTTAGLASSSESLKWRFENWQAAWAIFKDYPFFGIGLDLSAPSAVSYLPPGATEHEFIEPAVPHNIFLFLLSETGLISCLLMVLIWIVALNGLLRAARTPGLRGYAAGIFTALIGLAGTFFFNPMPREIWLALALCMAVGRIARTQNAANRGSPEPAPLAGVATRGTGRINAYH